MSPETVAELLRVARCGWEEWETDKANANLIAAAVTALPELLDELDAAQAESANLQADYDRRGERLWRLAAAAGHVPHESDNDATAELVVSQALNESRARDDLDELLLAQAREGDAAAGEVAGLRVQLERARAERDRLIDARQKTIQRYRRSLDETLNRLVSEELDAGNTERAAALRSLRAWNRGAAYVVPRARPS